MKNYIHYCFVLFSFFKNDCVLFIMNVFQRIPVEMVDLVLNFLSPIELINTKQVSKEFYEISKKQINKKINKQLENIDPIVRHNLSENVMLSGSTVLGLLHQESYDGSDIDIYCDGHVDDIDDFTSDLLNNNYTLNPPMYDTYPGAIYNVLTYSKENCPNIQLIISISNINLINNFDLDIVQNYFDGNSIRIKHPESVRSHTIYAINIIDSRKTCSRIQKYRNRGYTVSPVLFDMMDNEYIVNWREGPGNYKDVSAWAWHKYVYCMVTYKDIVESCNVFSKGILCPDRRQQFILDTVSCNM